MALGVLLSVRWSSERWPRLILDVLHRNLSMLALAVIVVHILTSVLDPFAPIGLRDAVVPFGSSYRPVWLGLGALAFDVLVAVAVTSALRPRLGYRAWRIVHWSAYVCWPVAIVHGFGTGTDTRVPWMLLTSLVCVAAVLAAAGWRVGRGWPTHSGVRVLSAIALSAVPVGLAVWLPSGPLAKGWARKAGTPATLLASAATTGGPRNAPSLPASFTAQLSGTAGQSEVEQGVSIDLPMQMSGATTGNVDVRLLGQPLPDGGLSLSQGSVTAGPPSSPTLYSGNVTGLSGDRIAATVSSAGRPSIALEVRVTIDPESQSVTGTVTGTPAARTP